MRRFAAILFLLGFLFIGGKSVRAQYYSWGADAAALRWKHLRTEDVRVVFPDTASALAHRTLHYIQAVRPTITHGFSHPPLKIPFVLHTENFQSNGLVMWMPKRIEFLTTPSVDSYSMPWVKQLVAHEYRHAVQYNNLNRGLIRILSYLIGQQGSTVGLLFMPLWALEGDAVMNETEMSSYGRGRQPRFTIEYRALGYEVLRRRNCDKWFCGSYRDFVPDHYQMGYQMVAYGYDRYGGEIWDKTLRYGVRNAYMLTFSTSVALRKFYGTGEGILFRDAFADLNRFWDSLPKVADSGRTLTPLPEKNYTTYTHPVSLNNTTLVALKTDFDRPSRLVTVDSRTGRERRRTWTGLVSSRPATDGQRVWWTEYRRSLLFPERVNSRLVVLDPGKKRPRTAPKLRNALYPTPIGRSGVLAWVEYTPDGHYTIVAEDSLRQRTAWPMPGFSEVHGLAWDNATERLYTLVTDDSGMWIGRIEPGEGLQAVTRGAYITLSDLRAADGKAERQPAPAHAKYWSAAAGATLPLYFDRGHHIRQLSISAGWEYSNGMVADVDAIRYDAEGRIANLQTLGYREGLHKLSLGIGFSDVVRAAYRDVGTPWGYTLWAGYDLNPENRNFSDLVSAYARIYTPGFFRHNSLSVAAAYQTSVGGYRFPSGLRFLGYKSTRLLPRGFSSSDISSNNYLAGSVDYQFPLCYPEGGISGVIYFKRIRLNVGADYARFQEFGSRGKTWRDIYSYGGDLLLDLNILRMSAAATATVKLSLYKPSEGSCWFGFGLELPF